MKKDMNVNKFIKELSKYPKEIILKTAYSELMFRQEEFIHNVKWNDINDRFDRLMEESKNIREQMKPLIGEKDIESVVKYIKLTDKDTKIQTEINKVMKEMDRLVNV